MTCCTKLPTKKKKKTDNAQGQMRLHQWGKVLLDGFSKLKCWRSSKVMLQSKSLVPEKTEPYIFKCNVFSSVQVSYHTLQGHVLPIFDDHRAK